MLGKYPTTELHAQPPKPHLLGGVLGKVTQYPAPVRTLGKCLTSKLYPYPPQSHSPITCFISR